MPAKTAALPPEHAAALMAATATIVAATLASKIIGVGSSQDIADLTATVARTLRESAT